MGARSREDKLVLRPVRIGSEIFKQPYCVLRERENYSLAVFCRVAPEPYHPVDKINIIPPQAENRPAPYPGVQGKPHDCRGLLILVFVKRLKKGKHLFRREIFGFFIV